MKFDHIFSLRIFRIFCPPA